MNEVFFGDDDLFKSLQLPNLFMLCKLHTIPKETKRFKVWVGIHIEVLQLISKRYVNEYVLKKHIPRRT
jgi:hypothetical protein